MGRQDRAKRAADDSHQEQEADKAAEAPIMSVESQEQGKNAYINLYSDRIERVKERSALSLSRAPQETETIPLARVGHVQSKKKGLKTNVGVRSAAEDIVFRCWPDEATAFEDAVFEQLRKREEGGSAVAQSASGPAPEGPAEQVRKLRELREQGLLTEEEFETKKAEILKL